MTGAHAKQPATRTMKHDPFCALDGCSQPYYAKGYCRKHWDRTYRNGVPVTLGVPYGTDPVERLMMHTERQGDCLVLTKYVNQEGYGAIDVGGTARVAHRVVYEAKRGPIPHGYVIRHKCDNPPCIELEHLEPGTPGDNMRDKAERGRAPKGSENPSAKLLESHVAEIRAAIAQGSRQRDLARRYGVGQSTISRIKKRTHWKHVGEVNENP